MKDFTVAIYTTLLQSLINKGYRFLPFCDFISSAETKIICLRHDVDDRKQNSLAFAKIQARYGIKGTYYFRTVPQSFDEEVIKEIASLGHEIGYHYETMDTARGNVDRAYHEFCQNLELFRKITPITTICMHGSPMSKYDNRDIWKKYDYRKLGLLAEPYFDIDFNKIFYLTDTGRRWDGEKVSVRDKAMKITGVNISVFSKLSFHSTPDIINAVNDGILPEKIMFTFHPQRWNDNLFNWATEFILQNLKNSVKFLLIKTRA